MLITNEKIEVTEQMMFNAGLSRMFISYQLAVPNNPTKDTDKVWKMADELTEDDFDKIELYFIAKNNNFNN